MSELSTIELNLIFSYLPLQTSRQINKYWYDLSSNKKNYIWRWYKYHSLRLEMEYEYLDNDNAIRAYYKLKTPLHIKYELVSLHYSRQLLTFKSCNINRLFNNIVDNISIRDLLRFYVL